MTLLQQQFSKNELRLRVNFADIRKRIMNIPNKSLTDWQSICFIGIIIPIGRGSDWLGSRNTIVIPP